jgi:hypothetical protein
LIKTLTRDEITLISKGNGGELRSPPIKACSVALGLAYVRCDICASKWMMPWQ